MSTHSTRPSLPLADLLCRYRLKISMLALALFCAGVLLTKSVDPSIMRVVDTAGAVLILAGGSLRFWSLLYISGRKKRELVTAGPYRYTRNPLYLGTFLMAAGMCCFGGSWAAAVPVLALFLLVYPPTIRVEERNLAGWFGEEYARYASEVPRFLPGLKSVGRRSDGRPRLSKPFRELTTLPTLLAVAWLVPELMEYLHILHNLPDWLR